MSKSLAYVGLLSCMLALSGCKDSDQQADQAGNSNSESSNSENNNTDNSNSETNNSGSNDSGTNNSGSNDSGTNNSGSNDSGTSNSGGNDSGSNNSGGNDSGSNNSGNSGSETGSSVEEKMIAVAEEVGVISLRESFLSGVVDSVIYGTDEASIGKKCTSGSYTRTGDVILFNQCRGLFQSSVGLNQFEGLIANGQVTIKEGEINVQGLVLNALNGRESRTVTGIFKTSENAVQDVISASNIAVIEKELINNTLNTVNYTLTDYELVHKRLGSTELSVNTKGTIKSVGGAVGDYHISFKTDPALVVETNPIRKDEFVGYPYAGSLLIHDLDRKTLTVFSSNADKKTLRYKITRNDKLLAEGTKPWQQALGF